MEVVERWRDRQIKGGKRWRRTWRQMGTHRYERREGLATVWSDRVISSSGTAAPHPSISVRLSLCCLILSKEPLLLEKWNSQIWRRPSEDKCCPGGCVCVWRTERHARGQERKPWEEKMVKAKELRNTTRICTELSDLPTYSQAGLGHEGLRE